MSTLTTARRMRRPNSARIGRVVAIVPARNEAASIGATVQSILAQTTPPDEVLVVVNNTTDNTAEMAEAAGATALILHNNQHKKAGALNYALEILEESLSDTDAVLVMDADTTLDPKFIAQAVHVMGRDRRIGAVSSVFVGRDSSTLLGKMQQMEYYRYRRDIARNGDRAFVVSGTAALIRFGALKAIKAARLEGVKLPKGQSYYDTHSLTEDNELTFALLTLGYECPAPGATSTTDVMETLKALWHQRHRWYLGALVNIWHYGRKMPWHMRVVYWKQQAGLAFSVIAFSVITVAFTLSLFYPIGFSWWTAGILAIHLVERTATVWKMGIGYRLIALSYFPELLYSVYLLLIYIKAAMDHLMRRQGSWHAT